MAEKKVRKRMTRFFTVSISVEMFKKFIRFMIVVKFRVFWLGTTARKCETIDNKRHFWYYRPGWEEIGTAVEHYTPFLSVSIQKCDEFPTWKGVFRCALQNLY